MTNLEAQKEVWKILRKIFRWEWNLNRFMNTDHFRLGESPNSAIEHERATEVLRLIKYYLQDRLGILVYKCQCCGLRAVVEDRCVECCARAVYED